MEDLEEPPSKLNSSERTSVITPYHSPGFGSSNGLSANSGSEGIGAEGGESEAELVAVISVWWLRRRKSSSVNRLPEASSSSVVVSPLLKRRRLSQVEATGLSSMTELSIGDDENTNLSSSFFLVCCEFKTVRRLDYMKTTIENSEFNYASSSHYLLFIFNYKSVFY